MAPEPLPVAPASIANQLNMALSSQSSLLANMNFTATRKSQRRTAEGIRRHQEEEDAENNTYGDETAGIGYVRQGKNNSKSQGEDAALSKRLLGKRKIGGDDGKMKESKKVESSEDEDEGRGSLGKRKRPKRVSKPGDADHSTSVPAEVPETKVDDGTGIEGDDDGIMENIPAASLVEANAAPPTSKNKKKKKKNKKKRKDAD